MIVRQTVFLKSDPCAGSSRSTTRLKPAQPTEMAGPLPRPPVGAGVRSVPGYSLASSAHAEMRRRILENEWMPGFRALEQELAAILDMSRTPVREAMLRLQDEGLVEVVPRHGMRVLPVSLQDMREIYQVLTALESAAAQLAARAEPDALALSELSLACDAMEAALERDDRVAWAQADERFHSQLLELSGNRTLAETVYRHWDRAHRVRLLTLRLRPSPVESTREHRELIVAIRNGDATAAENIHRQHRERGADELLGILEVFQLSQV